MTSQGKNDSCYLIKNAHVNKQASQTKVLPFDVMNVAVMGKKKNFSDFVRNQITIIRIRSEYF